jgi:hypothetical protein
MGAGGIDYHTITISLTNIVSQPLQFHKIEILKDDVQIFAVYNLTPSVTTFDHEHDLSTDELNTQCDNV